MIRFTSIPKHVEDAFAREAGAPSRRNFLKTSGMLVVGATMMRLGEPLAAQGVAGAGP